jgi:hypothetical protein
MNARAAKRLGAVEAPGQHEETTMDRPCLPRTRVLRSTVGAGSRVAAKRASATFVLPIVALLLALTVFVLPAHAAPPPVIRSIVVGAGTLDIRGEDLDIGGAPTVRLGTTVLAVQTSSAERVVVQLPAGVPAGSQRLRVRRSDGLAAKAMIEIGVTRQTTVIPLRGAVDASIAGNAPGYVFVGGGDSAVPVVVGPGQTIVGAGSVALGLAAGSAPQRIQVGLCYKSALFGALVNFTGLNYTRPLATSTSEPTLYPVSGSVAPEPGAYSVGICVSNNSGPAALTQNDYYNGWVMVVD